MKHRTLVLDVAGVIIDVPTRLDTETWLRIKPRFLEIPAVASLALMRRVIRRFDCTYLVSAASDEDIVRHTRCWLNHYRFWSVCNVPPENLHFCEPGAEEKRKIIERLPPVNLFIDDRPENVATVAPHVERSVFYDRDEGEHVPTGVVAVRSWEDILSVS